MSSTVESAPVDLEQRSPEPVRVVGRSSDLLITAAACVVVLVGLHPELLVTDSMPLGTDLVGHAVVAWFDSKNPLGFLPGSWSNDMFNGFPVNQLYPWLPSWLVGALSWFLPLSVAIKVGAAIPLVALPWAAWRAGSWAGLPRPLPVMLAVATVPFMFDTSCGSCGGTLYATTNGEYAFAWAMLFGVLALGAVDRLARTGRGGLLAAGLVTATAFSHPLPTLWLVVGIATIAIGREIWSRRDILAQFAIAAAIATLMSAMWWLPFAAYQDWMPKNPLVRAGGFETWLFPATAGWEIGISLLAVGGLVWAVRRRTWLLIAYAVGSTVAVAAFFRFADGGPFYSIRVLPFWQFGRWALAGVGFAWLVQGVVRRLRADRTRGTDPRIAPVVWLATATLVIGTTWGWWGVTTAPTSRTTGVGGVLGYATPVTFAEGAVRTTLSGFAARDDYAQLLAVQQLLRDVAQRNGCGTLMWDNGDVTQETGPVFGDPQVFWQSSIWTEGCITSADGVLVDSSMTAPGMAMTKSLVSQSVEPLLPERPTFTLDIALGAKRMQAMGVRYYLTQGGQPAADAAQTPLLALVAQAGPWQVWQVDKGVPAASLAALPAVFTPRLADSDWESVTNAYFTTENYNEMPLVQDGASQWPTASLRGLPTPSKVEPAGVSNIRYANGRVTFDVARTGSPVIVRVSDFPGWSVVGAEGPYRASPNYLVVVPTSTTVTLTKGRTTIDWLASAAGIAGLALLVGYGLYRRLQGDDDDASDIDDNASETEHDARLEDDAALEESETQTLEDQPDQEPASGPTTSLPQS